MRERRAVEILVAVAALALMPQCGAGSADSAKTESPQASSDWGAGGGWEGAGDASAGAWEEVAAGADYGPPPPPETEMTLDLRTPQASQNYVYIAATDRDSLVRISAEEPPGIRIIPVGGKPTVVATLTSADVALVINSGTQDFSVVRSSPDKDDVTTLEMLPYVNAISVSPEGKYAIVYYNEKAAVKGDPIGDFQTVAVVVLDEKKGDQVYQVSTGFHLSAVYFHQSKPIAYLVTDDGISVLTLDKVTEGLITPIIPVTDDPLEDPEMREVLVTEDGDYAVVRNLALPRFTVVDLETEDLAHADIKGLPTDVDLIPQADKALLLLREQALAYVVDMKGIIAGTEGALVQVDIKGSMAGAAVVTRDGSRAVIYTTVGKVKSVAVLDLKGPDYAWKSYPVQKGVVGVAVSDKGTTAIILHEVEGYTANASALEKTIAAADGFTLFNLDSGYRKLIQTEDHWSEHLFVSDPQKGDLAAFVLTPDYSHVLHHVQAVNLKTYIVDPIPISSNPVSMVYVPLARKVAVAQDHENGRITFIDVDTLKTYSVTGYELNGMIH